MGHNVRFIKINGGENNCFVVKLGQYIGEFCPNIWQALLILIEVARKLRWLLVWVIESVDRGHVFKGAFLSELRFESFFAVITGGDLMDRVNNYGMTGAKVHGLHYALC